MIPANYSGPGWLCVAVLLLVQPAGATETTSRNYHLFPRDVVRVSVFGEPDMSVERRIDGDGSVDLPLIGAVQARNLTVTELEERIRERYLDGQFFVHPQVAVAVAEYAPKEIAVMGQVKNPGAVALPMEADTLPLVVVISRAGGFTRIGRAESVRITRSAANGSTRTFIVNVKNMLDGQGRPQPFMTLPGDVVFVPEAIF
jgi:polysaccharide export outer membrane protein